MTCAQMHFRERERAPLSKKRSMRLAILGFVGCVIVTGPASAREECHKGAWSTICATIPDQPIYIPSGPSPQEIERRRLNEEGNRLFTEGRYEDAIRSYEMALTYGPDDGVQSNIRSARFQIAFNRGQQAYIARNWDAAVSAYNEALAYGTTHPSATQNNIRLAQYNKAFDRGQELFAARDWSGAIAAYNEALAIRPESTAAHNNIQIAKMNQQNEIRYNQKQAEYSEAFLQIKKTIDDLANAILANKSSSRPNLSGIGSAPDLIESSKSAPVLVFGDTDSLENVHRDASSGFDTLGGLLGAKSFPPISVSASHTPPFKEIPSEARDDPQITVMVGWYERLEEQRAEAIKKLNDIAQLRKVSSDSSLVVKREAVVSQIKRIETDQKTALAVIKETARRSYGKELDIEGGE